METHNLGIHRDVRETDRVEEFLAQWDKLVKAVLAAVIAFGRRAARTVVVRVRGAGTGPANVFASRIVGSRVTVTCPPITRTVVAVPCAHSGGEGIVGRSCVRVTRGDSWSREAPGLRVRPGGLGRSDWGCIIRHGLQICTGRGRRRWYRGRVARAPSGMFDCSDHGVPFSREFRSRGAEGSIESFNAV